MKRVRLLQRNAQPRFGCLPLLLHEKWQEGWLGEEGRGGGPHSTNYNGIFVHFLFVGRHIRYPQDSFPFPLPHSPPKDSPWSVTPRYQNHDDDNNNKITFKRSYRISLTRFHMKYRSIVLSQHEINSSKPALITASKAIIAQWSPCSLSLLSQGSQSVYVIPLRRHHLIGTSGVHISLLFYQSPCLASLFSFLPAKGGGYHLSRVTTHTAASGTDI